MSENRLSKPVELRSKEVRPKFQGYFQRRLHRRSGDRLVQGARRRWQVLDFLTFSIVAVTDTLRPALLLSGQITERGAALERSLERRLCPYAMSFEGLAHV
jgi:hypothetical protein